MALWSVPGHPQGSCKETRARPSYWSCGSCGGGDVSTENDEFSTEKIDFTLKRMNSTRKMMNFPLNTMNCPLEMMNVAAHGG